MGCQIWHYFAYAYILISIGPKAIFGYSNRGEYVLKCTVRRQECFYLCRQKIHAGTCLPPSRHVESLDNRHRQQHHHIIVDLRHIVDLRRIHSSCSFHPMLSMGVGSAVGRGGGRGGGPIGRLACACWSAPPPTLLSTVRHRQRRRRRVWGGVSLCSGRRTERDKKRRRR